MTDWSPIFISMKTASVSIFIAKKFMKKLPIGPLTPKIYNRKNPTTVGGNTIGSVKIPSSIKIDTLAVFIEMKIGDQSVMSKLLKKILII